MDSFLPVSFMSIFYGFLKLINFPPFVRNSWHRHKPRRRETLPTGYMSKLSGFQSQVSGGKARFHMRAMQQGEPCQCVQAAVLLVVQPPRLQRPLCHWQASYSPRQPLAWAACAPRATFRVDMSLRRGRAAPGLSARRALVRCRSLDWASGFSQPHRFFPPPGGFAAKDNELNGISPAWRRKSTPRGIGPHILLLSPAQAQGSFSASVSSSVK